MADSDAIPLGILRSFMDPEFNGTLVEVFGCGIYTLLTFQVVWKLYWKGGKLIYASALIVMWMSSIVSSTSDWLVARAAFVSSNSSPLAMVMSGIVPSLSVIIYVSTSITGSISDAIIIWRCHVLWQNRVILSVLVVLLCTAISFKIYADLKLFPNGLLGELIQALSTLASFITTVSATFLIALKIILVTRQTHRRHHYTKIINILVQSAAILSIVLLGLTVLSLIDYVHPFDLTTTNGMLCYMLEVYLSYSQSPIAGIAPTLIALRVAEEETQSRVNSTNRSAPLTRLTFRRTAPNTNAMGDITTTPAPAECT